MNILIVDLLLFVPFFFELVLDGVAKLLALGVMSGEARFRFELRELGCAEDLEPLLWGCGLLLDLFFLLLSLLLFFSLLISNLIQSLLQKYLLIFVLPDRCLTLCAVLETDSQMREEVVSELIAKLEESLGSLCLIFHLVTELSQEIHQWGDSLLIAGGGDA